MITVGKKIWPVCIIIALWVIFSVPYFFKGLVPFPSDYLVSFFPPWNASYAMPVKNNAMPDIITQIYPWKKLTIETWKQGIIPLWNPYAFSGTVHAGNYQTAAFSPVNALFFILPFIDAWSIAVLLQPLLAGLFTYLFMRQLNLSKPGSLIGAVGFMFCGFMTTWMAYGTLGYAIIPLPLVLFAVSRFMKNPRWWQPLLISGGIWFSMVSGHFQISVYCILFIVGFIAYVSITENIWRKGLVVFLYVFLGVALSAPQLVLTFDAFNASVRGIHTLAKEVIPWQYIITVLSPDFYGNPVTRNDWFGHYAEWSAYIGVIPFLLALFGIVFSKQKIRAFFIIAGVAALLLAYTSPLSYLLFFLKIPILSTSAASRIIVLVSFSLAILSGFGLDTLIIMWKKREWKKVVLFIGIIGIIICGLWISLFVFRWLTDDRLLIAKRNLLLPTLFAIVCFGLMMAGFIKRQSVKAAVLVILITGVLFDAFRFSSKWMPYEERNYLYPETPMLSFLTKTISYDRAFGNVGGEVGNYFHIGLIDGYDAMYQGRYGEFINTFGRGIVSPPQRSVVTIDKYGQYTPLAFQLLDVRYIIHRISDGRNVWAFPFWQYPEGDMKSIYKDGQYEIFEYTKTFPRAYLASSYVLKTDKEEIIDALFTLDMRNTLVLETSPGITPQEGEGSVAITSYLPGTIILRAETSVPKLLFVSEAYDPGWEARIDGKKTEVYRADYDFLGVAVPEGSHEVVLRYAPKSFQWGVIVMFGALGALCFLILLPKKKL